MKTYVCAEIYDPPSGYPVCKTWIEQQNFLAELANLSYSDMALILSMTAALFATAWVWRLISKQALR